MGTDDAKMSVSNFASKVGKNLPCTHSNAALAWWKDMWLAHIVRSLKRHVWVWLGISSVQMCFLLQAAHEIALSHHKVL